MYIYLFIGERVRVCLSIYIYIYIHAHTHTHTNGQHDQLTGYSDHLGSGLHHQSKYKSCKSTAT